MKLQRIILWGVFVFLVSFMFTQLLFQNMPFNIFIDNSDLTYYAYSMNTSYSTLMKTMFTKQTGLTHKGGFEIEDRTFIYVVYKLFAEVFPINPFYYHFLRSIVVSIITVLIYYMIYEFTKDFRFSVIGAVTYTVLPAVIASSIYITDFALMAHMFLFIAIILLYKYLRIHNPLVLKTTFTQIVIFLLAILAIKTREDTKIIIPLIFLLILLYKRKELIKWVFFFALLTYFIMPQSFDHNFASSNTSDILDYFVRWTYQYKGGDYPQESISVMWSPIEQIRSLAASFVGEIGFFLFWSVIFLLIRYFWTRSYLLKRSYDWKLFLFCSVWLILGVAVLSVRTSPEIRYLAPYSIPLVIFLSMTCWTLFNSETNHRKVLGLLLIIAVSYTFVFHVYHSFQDVRGKNGGLWILSYKGMKQVLQWECNCNMTDTSFYETYSTGNINLKSVILDFRINSVPVNSLETIKINKTFYYFSQRDPVLPENIANMSLVEGYYTFTAEVDGAYKFFKQLFRPEKPQGFLWKLSRTK